MRRAQRVSPPIALGVPLQDDVWRLPLAPRCLPLFRGFMYGRNVELICGG